MFLSWLIVCVESPWCIVVYFHSAIYDILYNQKHGDA